MEKEYVRVFFDQTEYAQEYLNMDTDALLNELDFLLFEDTMYHDSEPSHGGSDSVEYVTFQGSEFIISRNEMLGYIGIDRIDYIEDAQ